MNLIITMSDPHDPKEIRGWHDGSRAGFSTDRLRAKPFPTHRAAQTALGELRQRFPSQVIHIRRRAVAFVPGIVLAGGGGTLMEIGGDVPQLLAPAGDGTFLEMP